MNGRIKNKVKYTLFTIIVSILMAFVFGCQPLLEFGSSREKNTEDDPYNWLQSEAGEKNEEKSISIDYLSNFYAPEVLKRTSGVSFFSNEYAKGYTVNDVSITFEEGSLDSGNVLYDSLSVNGKIFGEKFYSEKTLPYKILSELYFNGHTTKYVYDKEKIKEAIIGEDKYEYEYDGKGRIEKIFKNVRKNSYNRDYFLYRQYVYSDTYTFDETAILNDPLTQFFLFEQHLLENPFIAELRYPVENEPSGGRVYSFSKESILLYYTDLEFNWGNNSRKDYFLPKQTDIFGEHQIAYKKLGADPVDSIKYNFSHEYLGNSYMTKRTVKEGDYNYSYSYEYINDKIVSESCFDGKKSQGYDITYIFDNAFNRTGFVYNNEVFYYVCDIFGNAEKIVDADGNTVVKYGYDLYGNIEITGARSEDIGLYNSYTYRCRDDWYHDNNLGFYYVGHDKIFDIKSGSFIDIKSGSYIKENARSETVKDFIEDPVNRTIKNDKLEKYEPQKKESLLKETLIKEKTMQMAGENLSYENFKPYSNVLVWDHSDFYSSYNGVSGLVWENTKAVEKTSLGRADIYTAPGYTETGGDYGSEVYIVESSKNLAFAQNKLFNLTDINSYVYISDNILEDRYYTYKGTLSFEGHFIYLNKYVTYKSVANGIIEFSTKSNVSSNYDKKFGRLYNFDEERHMYASDIVDNNKYIELTTGIRYQPDWEQFDKSFMAKYDNSWGGCYVETACTTYYSEERTEALKKNTDGGITYFGGYDLKELKSQMGEDFGFTSKNGETTVIESKKSKDFDVSDFIADMAVGAGIIVVASTIIAMSGGSATPFVCFLVTSASLTAVSLAGGALAMGLNMALGGTWENALKDFSNAFMITAAVSSIAALTTGAGACFVAGTEVKTSKGVKAIENISKGDLVLSYNEITKQTEYKEVEETFIRTTTEEINIKTAKDDIITTPEHPFYSDGKWVQAKDLRAGDRLQDVNGKTVIVEQVQHELLETPLTVYNFRVKENHNYYVASGILVHNANYGMSTAMQLPSVNFAASSGLSLTKVLLFADIAAITFIIGGSISIPAENSVMRSITEAERKPRTKEWALLDYTANGGEMNKTTRFHPATEINHKLEMDHTVYLDYIQALAYLRLLKVLDTAGQYTIDVMQALDDPTVKIEVAATKDKIKGINPKVVHLGVYTECPSHAMELGVAAGCGPIRSAFAPAPANSVFYGDGDGYITAFLVATEKLPGYYHLRGPNDAFRIWCMYPAYMYMAHDGPDVRWINPRRDPVTGLLPVDDDFIYNLPYLWTDDYIKYQEWLLREFEAEHFAWQWWSVY